MTREITLSARDRFVGCSGQMPVSFYNFSNIFMWRRIMNYRYCCMGGALVLTGSYMGEPPFAFFPLGLPDDCLGGCIERITEATGAKVFRPLTIEMTARLEQLCPDVALTYRRDLCDYVYLASDLINLSGKKLHAKKNHVNSFTKKYAGRWEYNAITESNLPLLKRACDYLFTPEQREDKELCDEFEANNELIDNFSVLKLRAGVITVDGNIAAFTIGEQMNADTALIHAEKCDRDYDGLFTVICNEFVKREFSSLTYINCEEDMGHEGLRKAKLSYNPHHLNEIYSASMP